MASNKSIPQKISSTKNIIPGWNDLVKEHREKAIFWHTIWKESGSPKHGNIADIRRKTRAKYHWSIKQVKRSKDAIISNKLANHLSSKETTKMWSEVNKLCQNRRNYPMCVDGKLTHSEISNSFKAKYSKLYNSVSYNKSEMNVLSESIEESILSSCKHDQCDNSHSLNVSDVQKAINCLKAEKQSGDMDYQSNHIIYGGHKLTVLITILLNSMLYHNIVPEDFLKSLLIPIPKNKKSLNDSSNYRAIALSSILNKVMDLCLKKYDNIFKTCDLQYGFKSKHSTTQCTFAVLETIQYYKNKHNNVHVMLLDASQAFDRINFTKMFKMLIERSLCPSVVRLLLNLYVNQIMCVRWLTEQSDFFSVTNGVKQGGVMSPILFSMYLDNLLEVYKQNHVGCHIGQIFLGAFCYADDIILLAPSKTALCIMLSIADTFAKQYDILFNPSKCKYLVFGDFNGVSKTAIELNDTLIECTDFESHLGNPLFSGNSDKWITDAINSLLSRYNQFMGRFKFATSDVKYMLFKSYCVIAYGCQLWNFEDKVTDRYFVAWRKCIRKLFNIPATTHSALLHCICNDNDIDHQLHRRVTKFVSNCVNSKNTVTKLCATLAINGSSSNISSSINHICSKYNIPKYKLNSLPQLNKIDVNEDIVQVACTIQDMMGMRDSILISEYDKMNINTIIYELCVN